jgi:hypothetical protein
VLSNYELLAISRLGTGNSDRIPGYFYAHPAVVGLRKINGITARLKPAILNVVAHGFIGATLMSRPLLSADVCCSSGSLLRRRIGRFSDTRLEFPKPFGFVLAVNDATLETE